MSCDADEDAHRVAGRPGSNQSAASIILSPCSSNRMGASFPSLTSAVPIISWLNYNKASSSLDGVTAKEAKDQK